MVHDKKYTLKRNDGFIVPRSGKHEFMSSVVGKPKTVPLPGDQPRTANQVILTFKQYVCSFVSDTHPQIESALESADFSYKAVVGEIASSTDAAAGRAVEPDRRCGFRVECREFVKN